MKEFVKARWARAKKISEREIDRSVRMCVNIRKREGKTPRVGQRRKMKPKAKNFFLNEDLTKSTTD